MNSRRKARTTKSVSDLLLLMSYLRDPQHGCRWDLKQSMQSLTSHTLEEVYEVVDAVESGDSESVKDELGDLLFQIIFYAQIARENDTFDFADVAEGVKNKLLQRHPHVFPDGTLDSFGTASDTPDPQQVEANWEAIKNSERQGQGNGRPVSVMDDVPRAMPALERARKLQKRAASVGFDWQHSDPVLDKLEEEVGELREAMSDSDIDRIEAEFGDVLFSCVNLARHLSINPEKALRGANGRFEQRFRLLEEAALRENMKVCDASPEQLDLWWEQAKSASTD